LQIQAVPLQFGHFSDFPYDDQPRPHTEKRFELE